MNDLARKAIISLIVIIAVISLTGTLTQAQSELSKLDLSLLILSAVFYILSIIVWIISWAFLIKKTSKISYLNLLKIGLTSIYGALTPVQLGSEALRSIQLKHYFKISYHKSVSASMVVKGFKFLVLLISAFFILGLFFSKVVLEPGILFAFVTGFIVIALAVLIFLLPLNKSFGLTIAKFFDKASKHIKQFKTLSKFFTGYSKYLEKTSISALAITLTLACVSFVLEIFALFFAFSAANVTISLTALIVLMVLVSILERTPFLPKGIGVVELVAFNFLAISAFASTSLTHAQIGAAIITFDIVRLIFPTFLSFACLPLVSKSLGKLKKKKPKKRN